MNKKLMFLIGFLLIPFFLFPATSNSTLSINGIVPVIGDYIISVHRDIDPPGALGSLEDVAGMKTYVGYVRDEYTGNRNNPGAHEWTIGITSVNGFNLKGPVQSTNDILLPYVLEIEWDDTLDDKNRLEPGGTWNSQTDAGVVIVKSEINDNRVKSMTRDIFVTVQEYAELLPGGTYRDTITLTLSTN